MVRGFTRWARATCIALVLVGTVAGASQGPRSLDAEQMFAPREVAVRERAEASTHKWEVRLDPGRSDSKLRPRYSPGGMRLALTPISMPDLEGHDHLESYIRLGDGLTEGQGQRLAIARSREGGPYDRLWIDRDHDGSLGNETPVESRPHLNREKWWSTFGTSVQVTQTVDGIPFREDYPLNFWVVVDREDETPAQILFSRRGFLTGRVQIDGQDYDIILSDANNDALYGAGDFWDIQPVIGASPPKLPRRVGDFNWVNQYAFMLELADSTGRCGWLVRHDPGITREEDEANRDRFHEDRTASRAPHPLAFRRDVDQAIVRARAENSRYFLDFETSWCSYCKQMDQLVYTARAVVDAAQNIACIKVDGDERRDLVERFAVRGYPTGILFGPDGTELVRFSGYRSVQQMTAFFGHAGNASSGMDVFLSRIHSLIQDRSWAVIHGEVAARMANHPEDMPKLVDLAATRLVGASAPQAHQIAEEILRPALADDPNSARVLRPLAYLAVNQGHYDEAIQLSRALLTMEPNSSEFLNNLAWILSEYRQRYDEALELAIRAVRLRPDDAHALDTHGIICFHLGRFDEAERSLRKAVRLQTSPSSAAAVTRYHLAQVYEATGRTDEAADAFQRSLNLHEQFGGLTPEQVSHARSIVGEAVVESDRAGELPDDPGEARLIITESGRIRQATAAGAVSQFVERSGPICVLNDEVYVARQGARSVFVYNGSGDEVRTIPVPPEVRYYLAFVVVPDGRLAFLDNEDDAVYFTDSKGSYLCRVKINEEPDNRLQNVHGVVVGSTLVISENGRKQLVAIDLETYGTSVFRDLRLLPGPWLGAVTFADNLFYISTPDAVFSFNPGDTTERRVATLPTGMASITGIVRHAGHLFVTVQHGGALCEIDPDSGTVKVLNASLQRPKGLGLISPPHGEESGAMGQNQPPAPQTVSGEGLLRGTSGRMEANDDHHKETLDVAAVNDQKLYATFQAGLTRLIEQGRVTPIETLIEQLGRTSYRVVLPEVPSRKLSTAELYESCRDGVLVVGYLYKCKQCGRIHAGAMVGIALTASGVIATNYHVINQPEALAMGAMTTDGRVYAIKEALAADSDSDVAILQLDGNGLSPLALSTDAPVGTPVAVIGHPGRRFYTLTTGIISRHFVFDRQGKEIPWIAATAEIGPGSSGSPMLNAYGTVVGMASQTSRAVRQTDDHDAAQQMTFYRFVPTANILKLIQDAPSDASK